MSLPLWLGFLATVLVVALSPGPGAALSMRVGLQHGYRHALTAILGLQAALLMQLALVAAGLGALLAASEPAFLALKLAGAGYLVWLGIKKWRELPAENGLVPASSARGGFFLQGVLVNLGNPKAIVFIAALVPPFIDSGLPRLPQFLVIGATMCCVDVLVMSGYALLAGRFRGVARGNRAVRLQNRLFGGVFIAAGLALTATSRH